MEKLITTIKEIHKLSDIEIFEVAKKLCQNTVIEDKFYCYNFDKTSKVLLMAHVDIAGGREPIFEKVNNYIYKMIGADDRLGVSIIFHLLKEGFKFNFLLTNYEECGGGGACSFCDAIDAKELEHINLIVALDRRGSSHYVKYSDVKKEKLLNNYMSSVGIFEEGQGTWSDCQTITECFDIAHVNLATGYHLEHTNNEYFNINETEYTLFVCKNILKNNPGIKFKPKKVEFGWNLSRFSRRDMYKPYWELDCDYIDECFYMKKGRFLYGAGTEEIEEFKNDSCSECDLM